MKYTEENIIHNWLDLVNLICEILFNQLNTLRKSSLTRGIYLLITWLRRRGGIGLGLTVRNELMKLCQANRQKVQTGSIKSSDEITIFKIVSRLADLILKLYAVDVQNMPNEFSEIVFFFYLTVCPHLLFMAGHSFSRNVAILIRHEAYNLVMVFMQPFSDSLLRFRSCRL